MKKVLAILLCCCLVFQCAVQLGIMGLYKLNKSYIANNLCENRAKPQLKCNGKCHLKKQLKKASQEQEKEQRQQQEEAAAVAFVLPGRWMPQEVHHYSILKHYSNYSAPAGIVISADIFHPPQVA